MKNQYCTFRIGTHYFAVDILLVREIHRFERIYPIPHAPPLIRGMVNIRGQVHLIFDLHRATGIPHLEPNSQASACVIIFKPIHKESFGFYVDEITGVISVEKKELEHRDLTENELSTEVIKHPEHLVLVIQPERILNHINQQKSA